MNKDCLYQEHYTERKMKKKIDLEELENKILKILEEEDKFLSITKTRHKLWKKYNVLVSPQTVKKCLKSLVKKRKIEQK